MIFKKLKNKQKKNIYLIIYFHTIFRNIVYILFITTFIALGLRNAFTLSVIYITEFMKYYNVFDHTIVMDLKNTHMIHEHFYKINIKL